MVRMRIQKALSEAGVASRRAIEEMILEGRIDVNGRPVCELPCFVDLDTDRVAVDGRAVRTEQVGKRMYFLLNKPRGVVCTQRDPSGRPRAADLLPDIDCRVYAAGRLDMESTGLLLMSNDGDLTEYLTHPRFGVEKTYVVEVDGLAQGEQLEGLKRGVYVDGKRTAGARVKVLRRGHGRSLLEICLTEGRNREIRRMLAKAGYKVRRLKRVGLGPLTDRGLKIGSVRRLTPAEVRRLTKCGTAPLKRRSG